MFDYDRWLESPYTDQDEGCEHECYECGALGEIDGVKCEDCDGRGYCEGNCDYDPDYYEEDDD